MWWLQFIYLTNDYKQNSGRQDSSARSHTLKSAEKTHLLTRIFAQDKTCCSKPGVRHSENEWLSSHTLDVCALWSWTLQRMNTPEHPGWVWALGDLIPAPQTDLQQLRTSCSVLMASLHCSVLALNSWIGWRYSLNSHSYCGCHPVFIFLNSSLIKSPTVGLRKINQHFRIYSCFHVVLSIMSNMYFTVLLFSLNLITVQNWVLGGENTSLCLNEGNYQVWEPRVLCWICIWVSGWSSQGFMKMTKLWDALALLCS